MSSGHVKLSRIPTVIEKRLGHVFSSLKLFRDALTHSTYRNENPAEGPGSQRLEFIGDAVLGLLTSHFLFNQFTHVSTIELIRCRERLNRRENLAKLAIHVGLNDYILLGKGQKRSVGDISKRILANAFEALIGAVYLDGGYEAVKQCLAQFMLVDIDSTQDTPNFKSRLHQVCYHLEIAPPTYVTISSAKSGYSSHIQCEVKIFGKTCGSGAGPNQEVAEQSCARHVLEVFKTTSIEE